MVNAEQSSQLKQWHTDLSQAIDDFKPVSITGVVSEVQGTMIECSLPYSRVGDLCKIVLNEKDYVLAEVVGFNKSATMVAALGGLEGIAAGAKIYPLYNPHQICVSDELFGQVLDGFGRPLSDGNGAFTTDTSNPDAVPVIRDGIPPTQRPRISNPIETGVRAIDSMITLGEGQRVGVFAGAGCGKTTLIAELARGADCDAIVFGLIGERGRELREFLDHELDDELRSKSVLVCATSDRSSMERARAAFTATAIAEGFRESGKRVILLIDSLTRLARAQREIGLAAGEPPGRGGFPPSVYTLLPRLIERSGRSETGVITAIYTLLIEQDSMSDPIADEARSLLDGHIILARKLAEQGHYPAIDVQSSLSRTMVNVVTEDHTQLATRFRQLLSAYKDVEMLIKLGEYQPGNDPLTDQAVELHPHLMHFLQQGQRDPTDLEQSLNQMAEVLNYEAA